MARVQTVGKHEPVLLSCDTHIYIYVYIYTLSIHIHTFDLKLVDSISTSQYFQTSESVQKRNHSKFPKAIVLHIRQVQKGCQINIHRFERLNFNSPGTLSQPMVN